MIKIDYNGQGCKVRIIGKPDAIATEFEKLCECLLEQGFFNVSDLVSMLAIACSEKSKNDTNKLT
jgi:hypothetical protein